METAGNTVSEIVPARWRIRWVGLCIKPYVVVEGSNRHGAPEGRALRLDRCARTGRFMFRATCGSMSRPRSSAPRSARKRAHMSVLSVTLMPVRRLNMRWLCQAWVAPP
jgi:hypothetical protein